MKITDIEVNESIELGDNFDIELGNTVIESRVVGFMDDGVVLAADDKALALLGISGALLESVDITEVSLGDYSKKAQISRALAQIDQKFYPNKPGSEQTIAKRTRGLERAKVRSDQARAKYAAQAQQDRADAIAKDRENLPTLEKYLAQLQSEYDPYYEYSDDHSVWTKNRELKAKISDLERRIKDAKGLTENTYTGDPVYIKGCNWDDVVNWLVKNVGPITKKNPNYAQGWEGRGWILYPMNRSDEKGKPILQVSAATQFDNNQSLLNAIQAACSSQQGVAEGLESNVATLDAVFNEHDFYRLEHIWPALEAGDKKEALRQINHYLNKGKNRAWWGDLQALDIKIDPNDIENSQVVWSKPLGQGLAEGRMKEQMHTDAERMELAEFLDKYGDEEWVKEFWQNVNDDINEAKYQGRTVPLGKPMQGDVKKFKVYVKNKKGNVIKVNFGDPNMRIKKSNPARRKSFRARHRCATAKDRTSARYWSCRAW